jgi:hypothetical protein
MREGIPEGWSARKKIGDTSHSKSPTGPGSQHPQDRHSDGRVPQQSISPALPTIMGSPLQSTSSKRNSVPEDSLAGKSVLAQPQDNGGKLTPDPKWRKWSRNWVLWTVLGGLISGGMGFIAVAMLLKLPAAPNCPSIFWPMASASVRLHCAQVAANKQTVDDLLEAIALVKALPNNHPLREEINRFLEQWSLEILNLGDTAFQAGKLQEAIAIARKIPEDVPAYQAVEKQIERWQSIWSEAEAIYQAAEAQLPKQRWHQAFMTAVQLLNINNEYWATTKYEELKNRIETARSDGNKLAKAQSLAKTGRVADLLAAIKLAESIGANSYIYKDAQEVIPEFGHKMLDLAQEALDRRDTSAAIAIANQIPESTKLQLEAQDLVTIAQAWQSAWIGTIPSLEAAIVIAQKIAAERPLYNKAQELVARWQVEIEDVAHLDRARNLAQQGTVADLTAAIAEAQLVPDTNPRSSEANQEVNRWRRQVETIEDRPFLDRAENLAILEDVTSLQAAITEASQITRGRALYREAQSKIWNWTRKIQRSQDQPYLAQARLLASSGNLTSAITAAQQIRPGRALSREAQAAINDWRGQIQARLNWQEARQLALQGTPEALVQAIRLARRVPTTSPLRVDVNLVIAQWSQQMLNIARSRGESDIPGGIAIARQIPRGTDAYQAAQEQIRVWEKFLAPKEPISEPELRSL